ncbi:MAG TPA: phage holin family protein [Cyclobacteriaceae bacterium]|nr:phage holin family protein [Cyclobacteriaceae bacterium]
MEKIKDSIFKFLRLDNLVENLSGYFETRVALIKIEIREEIAKVISHGLMIATLALLGLLFLVFLSVGLANYLNDAFHDSTTGFWIVSGVYALAGLIIALFRRTIGHFFERYLIEQAKRHRK